jgi:LPPG:FO 2-phospho-L-lactate transferase
VSAVRFEGTADPAPGVLDALNEADAIIIAPSNPYVSIDPILGLPGVRAALRPRCAVGVSPLIGGRAVKGPLAEMIPKLAGVPPSAEAVARHYGDRLGGFLVHEGDGFDAAGLRVEAENILMATAADRERVARAALSLALRLSGRDAVGVGGP